MSSKASIRKKQQNRIFPLTEKKYNKSKVSNKHEEENILASPPPFTVATYQQNKQAYIISENHHATNIPDFNPAGPDPNDLPGHLKPLLNKRRSSEIVQSGEDVQAFKKSNGEELREYLKFCSFLMNQWNPENSGNLLKGYQVNCTERALRILNQSENDYTIAKFKILFPNSLLFDQNILKKMPRPELQNLVTQTQEKYYEDKKNQKDLCIGQLLNHLKNRMLSQQFQQFLELNQIQLSNNQLSEEIKQHVKQSEEFSQKLKSQNTPVSIKLAEELFKQSTSILLISTQMEVFQNQWHKALQLSQKIKQLNNSSITLRGVSGLIKQKKSIQIQIQGIAQLKQSHFLASKWFTKASGYFKKVKPRGSNYSVPQLLNIPKSYAHESEHTIQATDQHSQLQQQMETIDDLISEAENLELKTFDVIKLKNDLGNIRAWERKVLMLLEDDIEKNYPETLENFLEEGKQLKYSLPLIQKLSSMINLNSWERRSTQLLSTANNKIKKLEQLIQEGRQHNYQNQTMDKLIELMNSINQFQQGLSQNFQKKLTQDKLKEMYKQCDRFQVTIQAKSIIGRRLNDINSWVQKARLSMNSNEQDINLQKLKDLHDEWTVINVVVPQQEELRNIIYPTQGFVEKMKKLAKRYEKQANPQSKPGPKSKTNFDLNFLISYEKRPCAHQQCLEMIEKAPQIVKQDQQYQYLKKLLHEAAQWEHQALHSFTKILNKKSTLSSEQQQLQQMNIGKISQTPQEQEKKQNSQQENRDVQSDLTYMKQMLLKHKKYPIKKSIAAHVIRLYLIMEWKSKVQKSTLQSFLTIDQLDIYEDEEDEEEEYVQISNMEDHSEQPMENDIYQLMLLIKQGRSLCNQTTANFIEPQLALLKGHFEKLNEWMLLREKLNQQESQNSLIKSKNESYYQRLSESAENLKISGKFNCVLVIQHHYSKIQDWKQRCVQFFASQQKQPSLLEKLISQYNKLGVYLKTEIIPLRALQRCFIDWNNKVEYILSIRCQHTVQYKLNCVIELNLHNLSDRQLNVVPQDELNNSSQYCICRMDDNNMQMIACDRCNEWFHMKCLFIQHTRYRRLQEEDFICPLCEMRYIQEGFRPSEITQIMNKQDGLVQYQSIERVLDQGNELQIGYSPSLSLLQYINHQIINYFKRVEREIDEMKQVLGFSQIKEILLHNSKEFKDFRVVQSLQEWQDKNTRLEKLYLQGLSYPIKIQAQQEQILSILMQRDKIKQIKSITQNNPGKFEQCFQFWRNSSKLQKVAYSRYAKDYLLIIFEHLRNLAEDHNIITSTIQLFIREGGSASEARQILKKADEKNIFNENCVKLVKMLEQYDEWSCIVKRAMETRDMNMTELQKLIEKGMYLYLYENENKILQKLHENSKSWRTKAKSFIMSYSSIICHDKDKFYLCEEKLDEVVKLLEFYHEVVQIKLNQVERLEEIKIQLQNTIKHRMGEEKKQVE